MGLDLSIEVGEYCKHCHTFSAYRTLCFGKVVTDEFFTHYKNLKSYYGKQEIKKLLPYIKNEENKEKIIDLMESFPNKAIRFRAWW